MDLFRPTWKNRRWQARQAAMEKLTDQTLLAQVARSDGTEAVRRAATGGLTDEVDLIYIARTDSDFQVREAAVGKLANRAVLAEISATGRPTACRRSTSETDRGLAREGACDVSVTQLGSFPHNDPSRLPPQDARVRDISLTSETHSCDLARCAFAADPFFASPRGSLSPPWGC